MSTLTDDERTLLDHVEARRDLLVEHTRELIRTPSVNPYAGDETAGNEYEAQMRFKSFLDGAGATTSLVEVPADVYEQAGVIGPKGRDFGNRPCVVGEFTFGSGGPTILINTHMDTVGAAGMSIDPFAGEVRDGAIWGRGASDSKGNLVMGLSAIEALTAHAAGLNGRVVFESVVDEECNGSGAGTLACCLAGLRGDAALVIDGAELVVTRGCGGVLTAEIDVEGKSGHAAHAGSVNAIEKAFVIAGAIERLKARREAEHPGFRLNLGVFHAGSIPAVVPGEAHMGMNVSYEVAEAVAAREAGRPYGAGLVMDALKAAVAEVVQTDDWLREHPPAVTWLKDLYPFETLAEADLVRAIAAAASDVTGRSTVVDVTPAWLDAAHMAVQLGIPVVGFGCGAKDVAHGPTEHLVIDVGVAGAKAVALMLHRWLSG